MEEQFKITDYSVLENNVLRIFSMLEIRAEMNKAFVDNKIDVFKLNLSEEKLEDYFNKLIGVEILVSLLQCEFMKLKRSKMTIISIL